MIRKIYTLLILGLCLGFAACSDDNDGLDPNAAAPVIKFPMEQLDVDLNKVDNLPVVAVIKSQAGLQSVTMKLQTVEGVTEYKTVTEFFNPNSYSLSENLEYNANYEAFIIEATDKLNHVTSGTLPIAVTDVMARPVITFDPEEIIYEISDFLYHVMVLMSLKGVTWEEITAELSKRYHINFKHGSVIYN